MKFLKNIFKSKSEKTDKPEVLIELKSPYCPITAFVEQNSRVAYFYLHGPEESAFAVKSCWVRNLTKAPLSEEIDLMHKGIAPLLPEAYCKYPEGQNPLNKTDLEIIWLEEGDGAALLEKGEVLAIIPSWSGYQGFSGYARDCKEQSHYCWHLKPDNIMFKRVEKAKQYWDSWDSEFTPFYKLQPQIIESYEEVFGEQTKYYAIDDHGKLFPPKGMYLKTDKNKNIFITVGVSLRPQPIIEMYTENVTEEHKIELGLTLNSGIDDDTIHQIAQTISGQTNIPWQQITFLGEGHTINFDTLPNKKFTSIIFTSKIKAIPPCDLPDYNGSKIKLLWMVPITENERNYIMENNSDKLIDKLNKIGEDVFSLERNEVQL